MSDDTRIRVAKALTGWMNGQRQKPVEDLDTLPLAVRNAYLQQADDAIAAMQVDPLVSRKPRRSGRGKGHSKPAKKGWT